jgi:hypothetical protein
MGAIGDHDAPRIAGLLETGCHVGCVADRCVIHSKVVSDASHDHQTRVDALSHLKLILLRLSTSSLNLRFLYPQSRMDRPLRMILMRDRAPNRAIMPSPRKRLTVPWPWTSQRS